MIELKFKQKNPQLGEVEVFIRIIGKIIYLKSNNEGYSEQMLENLSKKGAVILRARGWLRINMFGANTFVKLGEREFDVNETPEEEVEKILGEFYSKKYAEAGFEIA